MKKVKIGILGFGVVGSGTVSVLLERIAEIQERSGIEIEIKKICDKQKITKAPTGLSKKVFTNNADDLLNDDEIQIVVEVIGGVGFAKDFIEKALKKGKHVVTANKYLLALHGNQLFELAKKNNVMLLFEAAVCGAIPCLRMLRKSFYPFKIKKIKGIFNGTANYILSQLQYKGGIFEDVLKRAQDLGYAEADPTFDVEGIDAAHKVAILANFGYGVNIDFSKVEIEGISKLLPDDFRFAANMGYKIKLVASIDKVGNKIYMSVRPTFVKRFSKLGQVDGVMNAVLIDGEFSGPILLQGHGAGGLATGTVVASDIIEIATCIADGRHGQFLPFKKISKANYASFAEFKRKTYLRVNTLDKVGVLANISKILASEKISIRAFNQRLEDGDPLPISFILDDAPLKNVQKAAKKLAKQSFIKGVPLVLPIDEDE